MLGDELAYIGAKVELVCVVTGLKKPLNDCIWVAPNKTEYDSQKDSGKIFCPLIFTKLNIYGV